MVEGRQVGVDPRERGARPPFPAQGQEPPAHEHRMDPAPDFGERSYRGSGKLKDRITLITGGDSGIGRAVALAFAREGAHVGIAYLSEDEDAERTREFVEEAGREALLLRGDLSQADHCRAVIDEVVERWGRIDVLVNNATYQRDYERFLDIPDDQFEAAFRTNVFATFYLCKAALPHMQPGASIINVASIQAYRPNPTLLPYSSTKGAIVTFTKGLAKECASLGIRVNSVAPGPVWTPLIVSAMPDDRRPEFGKENPMGRPAQPAELAPAFVLLASDDGSFINGEVLGVTGGREIP